LRIDPDQVAAIQTESLNPMKEAIGYGLIVLRKGTEIDCTTEEATEIALQWEQYLGDDPDEDEDDEDDEDPDEIDTAPLEIPETIDLESRPRRLRRKGPVR
jgi:hypothetical protein